MQGIEPVTPHRESFPLRVTLRPLALLLSLVGFGATSAAQQPYTIDRDQVEGPFVNMNFASVRPMLKTSLVGDQERLYTVNPHDSTVEYFLPGQSAPEAVWGVPWGPVSIELWPNAGSPRLLVVCRGSNALVQLDPENGDVLDLLNLRKAGRDLGPSTLLSEPGDLLLVGSKAYITCSATDALVEVDLSDNSIRVWNELSNSAFRMKSPLFLAHDNFPGHPERVMVAPLTSGNRSLSGPVQDSGGNSFLGVVDTSGWFWTQPDEDLFAIDPTASVAQGVTPAIDGVGTILFAHGVNPDTGEYWMLNTEALNKDPDRQSEPAIKGDFVENRLTRIPFDGAQGGWQTPIHTSLDEIPVGPSTPSLGQPYALAFHPDGHAFVAGLLTDNIAVLDKQGVVVGGWNLPAGSIPRGIVLDPDGATTRVYVSCWGTNEIREYSHGGGDTTFLNSYQLNHDPTPPLVKQGRELFYDGHLSEKENLSCATCHVEGRTDLTVWNLSNQPIDDKGPMMTQILVGIERLGPFHWRGERPGLDDFNGAFVGLLGHDNELDLSEGGAFDQFEAFVFSLQNPANPFVHRTRTLDREVLPVGVTGAVNPQNGQRNFSDPENGAMGTNSCLECHGAPLGTSNDIFQVFTIPDRPERSFMKVTPFHELYRKDMSIIAVKENAGDPREVRSFLGPGFRHDGENANLKDFISVFQFPQGILNNIQSFVTQFDQGLAPAVHYSFLLDFDSEASGEAATELGYLQAQAATTTLNILPTVNRRNCGIAVFGEVDVNGSPVPARWYWDAQSQAYRSDNPGMAPRSLTDFLDGAREDGERHVFVGLPTGMAERFAVDYDMDGLYNGDANELDPYVQATASGGAAPGFFESPTLTFVTPGAARLAFEANEPVEVLLEYWDDTNPAAPGVVSKKHSLGFSKVHSLVLSNLRPSTFRDAEPEQSGQSVGEFLAEDVTYRWRVTMTNLSQVDTVLEGSFLTDYFVERITLGGGINSDLWEHHTVVDGVSLSVQSVPGGHQIDVDVTALLKRGIDPAPMPTIPAKRAPAVDRAMAFAIFKRQPGGDWTQVSNFSALDNPPTTAVKVPNLVLSQSSSFTPQNRITMAAAGPYVIPPLTGSDGSTQFQITIPGLQSQEEVMVFTRAATKIRGVNAVNDYATQSATGFQLFTEDASLSSFVEFSFADSGEAKATATIAIP